MKKNKNSRLFKIILIIVDIIAIAGLLIITKNWVYNNAKKQEIVFKNFTFSVPNKIYCEVDSDYTFLLETDDYLANVKVYLDEENKVFTETDKYQYWMLQNGTMVDSYKKVQVLDKSVLIFSNYQGDSNTKLYYFKNDDKYLIEVKIMAKNKLFDTEEALKQIIDIFNNATYIEDKEQYYIVPEFTVDDQEYFKELKEVSD